MGGCLNLISVPAIAIVVYRVIKIIRLATGDNEKFKRFIPLVATGPGAVCGIICRYAVPSIIPSTKVVVAIVPGGSSGLSATGVNRMIKQLADKKSESDKNRKPQIKPKRRESPIRTESATVRSESNVNRSIAHTKIIDFLKELLYNSSGQSKRHKVLWLTTNHRKCILKRY